MCYSIQKETYGKGLSPCPKGLAYRDAVDEIQCTYRLAEPQRILRHMGFKQWV